MARLRGSLGLAVVVLVSTHVRSSARAADVHSSTACVWTEVKWHSDGETIRFSPAFTDIPVIVTSAQAGGVALMACAINNGVDGFWLSLRDHNGKSASGWVQTIAIGEGQPNLAGLRVDCDERGTGDGAAVAFFPAFTSIPAIVTSARVEGVPLMACAVNNAMDGFWLSLRDHEGNPTSGSISTIAIGEGISNVMDLKIWTEVHWHSDGDAISFSPAFTTIPTIVTSAQAGGVALMACEAGKTADGFRLSLRDHDGIPASGWVQTIAIGHLLPRVTLGFQGIDGKPLSDIRGEAGEAKSFDVYATLTTSNNPGTAPVTHGVSSWQFGVAISGGTITNPTLSGVMVVANSCEDSNMDGVCDGLLLPVILDLRYAYEKRVSSAFLSTDPSVKGVITWCILPMSDSEIVELQPQGTATVLKFTVNVTIPQNGCKPVTLSFLNGMKSQTVTDIMVVCNHKYATNPPQPNQAMVLDWYNVTFQACCGSGGLQLPGDASQDGLLNITDVIWILNHLFLGTEPKLPCEGGTSGNPGAGDLALVDFSDDGRINIVDPIAMLAFLFMGGDPPHIGSDCTPIAGCPDKCGQ